MTLDRINHRPRTLRALLRWAQNAYQLEPPPRLHDRDVADDGAPDHTAAAKAYLGFSLPRGVEDTDPDDWKKVACRLDHDGFYQSPLRCALERVPGEERRALLRAVLPNVLFPADAAKVAGIPDWCADDVLGHALNLLWDRYADRPIPQATKWTELSDAQKKAIEDGEAA